MWKQCCVSVAVPEPTINVNHPGNLAMSGPNLCCVVSDFNGPQLTSVRRLLLTEKGQKYVEKHFACLGSSRDTEADTFDCWDVYYDSRLLVLARRAARLRERAGTWELMVRHDADRHHPGGLLRGEPPLSPPDLDDSGTQCEMVTGEELILLRLGIDPQLTRGRSFTMREALALHDVRPIARLSADRRSYHAEKRLSGPVLVDLDYVRFDTAYAEPAAVAALLGQHKEGIMRKQALEVAFANFRMLQTEPGGKGAVAPTRIDIFLRAHGLDLAGGGSAPGTSALAAYLRACRPTHWRSLQRVGIQIEPQPLGSATTDFPIKSWSPEMV